MNQPCRIEGAKSYPRVEPSLYKVYHNANAELVSTGICPKPKEVAQKQNRLFLHKNTCLCELIELK